ncbi:helix-turn-helix domain-containing protein [Eubacterium ventriosum]|uniref:helix-turn-helix domain-containing protein n=1 Tax=Eubacterium ventriosum TaxID=39496 RepID=UPI00210C13D6|nr:helix-turn-helix transcriptional regulator [Eubacterium ventriosum]MCQ5338103.1 helix-turn-helix transcriptional regulator [Eubacterium ventriosum]
MKIDIMKSGSDSIRKDYYDSDKVGNRLQESREESKLTQEKAAEKLDIHINTLARYEHGATIPSEVLKKMCIIYQKSADYLIGNTNDNYYDVQIMRLLEQNDMKTNKAIYEIVERIMKIRVA